MNVSARSRAPNTNGCAHITGVDAAKCQSVLDCINAASASCVTEADSAAPCYCGAESVDMCFFETSADKLSGACTKAIEDATGGVIPLQVATIFYDNSTPVGAATQQIACEQMQCASDCF